MARKRALLLVLGVLVLAGLTPLAWAQCMDDPTIYCGIQCDWWPGGVYCTEPSNPERACYESVSGGACGEANPYEGCAGCESLASDGGF